MTELHRRKFSPRTRANLWAGLAVFGATLAAYWPVLAAGFIWDDDGHVTRPDLRSFGGLGRIWTRFDATQQYYPFLHSAFWLEHRVWGDAPLGYHLLNVLLHAASACLFAVVLVRLSRLATPAGDEASPATDWVWTGAWSAALLFALHPIEVESVAWVAEQKNTLSTFLGLVAALAYLRFERTRSGAAYAAGLLVFLAATLTKSVVGTLPAACLVLLWWKRGRLEGKRDILPLVPWLGLGAVVGLTTAFIERTYVGATGAAFAYGFPTRLLLAGRALSFYLGKFLWPSPLLFVYPRWTLDSTSAWQWLGTIGFAVALILAVWRARAGVRGPLAALLCYAGLLFPALGFFNVYPFVFSFVADHFQYLASLVLFGVVGGAIGWLWERRSRVRPLIVIGIGLLAGVLGALTRAQARIYRTETSLYEATLDQNPDAWLAHANLGALLARSGRMSEAIAHYQAALRINPNIPQTENDLGNALAGNRDWAGASAAYARAVQERPQLVEAYVNWGNVLAETGQTAQARSLYQKALALRPDDAEAEYRLGSLDANADDLDAAMPHFRRAIQLRPTFAPAEANLGLALTLKNDAAGALPHLERAVGLDPTYPEAKAYLGLALARLGRSEEAVASYRAALALIPQNADLHYQLALVLRQLGQSEEAAAELREANRLGAR